VKSSVGTVVGTDLPQLSQDSPKTKQFLACLDVVLGPVEVTSRYSSPFGGVVPLGGIQSETQIPMSSPQEQTSGESEHLQETTLVRGGSDPGDEPLFSVPKLTENMGHVLLYDHRDYRKAVEWYDLELSRREQLLGKDHENTLDILHALGIAFVGQRSYATALKYYELALAGRERALGKEHHATLDTVHRIGQAYHQQRDCVRTEEWFRQTRECYGPIFDDREKQLLGIEDTPETLQIVKIIGRIYYYGGHYTNALRLFERALAGQEKVLGKEHPATLETIHDIGKAHYQREYDEEAMKWQVRALVGREKTLGKYHLDTLDTLRDVGLIFFSQVRYKHALKRFQKSLAGREKLLGIDHPEVLELLHDIGTVFLSQRKCWDAEDIYERVLDGRKTALGEDHPDTLKVVHDMGSVFYRWGDYERALEWYKLALAGREKVLGNDHRHTKKTLRRIKDMESRCKAK